MNSLKINEVYNTLRMAEILLDRDKQEYVLALQAEKEQKELRAKYQKAVELEEDYKTFSYQLDAIRKTCNIEDINYKKRRLNYIEKCVEKNLSLIYPDEGFTCEITWDFKYNNQKVDLYLYNKDGELSIPRVNEGGFCRRLTGFSAASAVTESLGCKNLYMDEVFYAAHPDNLAKTSSLLQELVDKCFQMILIEQQDDIYRDLKRREIHVRKNPITSLCEVTRTIDY